MHPIVRLAKEAVEACIRSGQTLSTPDELSGQMKERAGVFVCLKRQGKLRGCIGTISPVTECVATEIIRNAACASTEDPRFPAVEVHELKDIVYSVDVLCAPEPVNDIAQLDPKKYGVIVSRGGRRGLLLPNLEGVDTVADQLRIACSKAGIAEGAEDLRVERFEVKRYE